MHDEVVAPHPSWVAYRPTRLGAPGAVELRVAYPGYTDVLRESYEVGQRAWEASRTVAYLPDLDVDGHADAVSAVGPYPDLVIWPIERGLVPIGGAGFLTVTEVLRRAVISRIADPVPAQVSGHGADGQPHVAYLPLLDVGHRHADGHLLGVAVAVPAMSTGDRIAVLRGLLGPGGDDPIRELRRGERGVLVLGDPSEVARLRGHRTDRWTAQPDGAYRWVSVTPVMYDRYPGRNTDRAAMIADAVVTAGYPRPAVTLLEAPTVSGAVAFPRKGTVPDGRPRRPLVHCVLKFAEPVCGPVIAGALRYLGCGLFVPEVSRVAR